jgi:hypothetical protein
VEDGERPSVAAVAEATGFWRGFRHASLRLRERLPKIRMPYGKI